MRAELIFGAAVVMAGCRYRPEPVPVLGDRSDIAKLAGDWQGEYTSRDSHRTGGITFIISAQGDSAFGEVFMPFSIGEQALRPVDLGPQHSLHARGSDVLSVNFVAVAGGQVRGELEPYIAPDCECVAHTVFTGLQTGNEIRGTFVTTIQSGQRQTGEWRVKRAEP